MRYRLLPLAALAVLLLDGCLYTSHHFNSGRILKPGATSVTLGYGSFKSHSYECDDWNYYRFEDSTGVTRCVEQMWNSGDTIQDTVAATVRESKIPKVSLGYRLGVRGPWGPFTGVEMGWHLEAPTNPTSAEFDLKFGLPSPWKAWHHAVSAGWIVGMWTDNSWFGEFAGSRSFGKGGDNANALYASYRLTRLATQPDDVLDSTGLAFQHRNRLANQATVGLHVRIPDLILLPDSFSPQVTFSSPWVPVFGGVEPKGSLLYDFNFGFGWRF